MEKMLRLGVLVEGEGSKDIVDLTRVDEQLPADMSALLVPGDLATSAPNAASPVRFRRTC